MYYKYKYYKYYYKYNIFIIINKWYNFVIIIKVRTLKFSILGQKW